MGNEPSTLGNALAKPDGPTTTPPLAANANGSQSHQNQSRSAHRA